MQAAVTGAYEEEDLDSLRERYLTILEEQLLDPLHAELTARRERMRERVDSPDPAVREQARRETERLPAVIALVEDVRARARHLRLSQLQALLGGPTPAW